MRDFKRKALVFLILLAFLILFGYTCVSIFERISRQQAARDSQAKPVVQDILSVRLSDAD